MMSTDPQLSKRPADPRVTTGKDSGLRARLAATLLCCLQFAAAGTQAEENSAIQLQRWVADPANSTLGFTATQEGSEFSGVFKRFAAGLEMQANEQRAILQSVNATINLGSVDTNYQDRDDYLAQQDWFHIAQWPEGKFVSEQIIDHGDDTYTANGKLSLRGISKPVAVNLILSIAPNRERGTLIGSAAIKRLDFGVGQGEWTNTEWVGNDVQVKFELAILRAFE